MYVFFLHKLLIKLICITISHPWVGHYAFRLHHHLWPARSPESSLAPFPPVWPAQVNRVLSSLIFWRRHAPVCYTGTPWLTKWGDRHRLPAPVPAQSDHNPTLTINSRQIRTRPGWGSLFIRALLPIGHWTGGLKTTFSINNKWTFNKTLSLTCY